MAICVGDHRTLHTGGVDTIMTCAGCEDCQFQYENVPSDYHEIHITVNADRTAEFLEVCEAQQIKAINVYSISHGGAVIREPMTSQRFKGTTTEALEESSRISTMLVQAGFELLRAKIETTPTNPIWEQQLGQSEGYWESHISVSVPMERHAAFLDQMRVQPNLYVSKNVKKPNTWMVTVRGYGCTASEFQDQTEQHKQQLLQQGLDIDRTFVEYCWFDTNSELDAAWMGN